MRRTALISGFFIAIALFSLACAPQIGRNRAGSPSDERPQLTEETIREGLSFARVYDIPEETASRGPISWGFNNDEPKGITVIERADDGNTSTIVLDIKTRSAQRAREPLSLEGQVKTYWELESGLVLRKWRITRTENVSMKYKVLPKPADANANKPTPGQ